MSQKVKGIRSNFNKAVNNSEIFKASFNKDMKVFVHALVIDIVSGNKTSSRFLPDEKFDQGGFFVICGVEKLERIISIQVKSLTYDQIRQQYGSDFNIIGRRILIECNAYDEFSIKAGIINFDPPYQTNYYENEDRNVPISYGNMFGHSSRKEDRMFYNQEASENIGFNWRPLI